MEIIPGFGLFRGVYEMTEYSYRAVLQVGCAAAARQTVRLHRGRLFYCSMVECAATVQWNGGCTVAGACGCSIVAEQQAVMLLPAARVAFVMP